MFLTALWWWQNWSSWLRVMPKCHFELETARLLAQGRASLIPTPWCKKRIWTKERKVWICLSLFVPILLVSHSRSGSLKMTPAPAIPRNRQGKIHFPHFLPSNKHGAGDGQLLHSWPAGDEWVKDGARNGKFLLQVFSHCVQNREEEKR